LRITHDARVSAARVTKVCLLLHPESHIAAASAAAAHFLAEVLPWSRSIPVADYGKPPSP
jgi:hypothetical protein